MIGERWEQIKLIVEEALRRAPEQRPAYLDSACGQDHELRAEVESLIAADAEAGSQFLAAAAPEILRLDSSAGSLPGDLRASANKVIGSYRLLEEIGRGGMGQVWLAEQTAPVRRRVALKLIRAGLYDDELLRRFQWERQSLALMDHPSIAKVFDAGATPEGQPYFVMEYVPGVPITEYCDRKRLKIRDRLRLFVQVCEAVQHAHQKAIIHRDLKPANILVQEIDGRPVPRIIDFGLAKSAGPGITGESLYTRAGSFVGTPGYMSPEQSDPAAADVDTRSDVYSLGVVLYVLLTGTLPFDSKAGKKQSVDDMLRRVREEDPQHPSSKIKSSLESSPATAQARGLDPEHLAGLLRGDLDWVAMKALERDRGRRYGTAAELAADIARYLNHEPVMARPASISYRLRKYVRRHRVSVAVVAGLVILLAGFAVVQALQLRRITRERDRANRIADFMTGIFKINDPKQTTGNKVTAREILDKASQDIQTGLANDPELQVQMMYAMGQAYMNLGLYARSQALLERSLAINGSRSGGQDHAAFDAAHNLGWDLLQQGKMAEAASLARKYFETTRRTLGPDNPDTLTAMGFLAYTLCEEGNCAEAVNLDRELLRRQTRVLGPEAYLTLVTRDDLSIALTKSGQSEEAEKIVSGNYQTRLRILGPENLVTIDSLVNLADMKRDLGKDEEAKELFARALEIETRVLQPEQPELAGTRYDLACLLAREGQKDEALSLLRQAVDHGLPPLNDLGIEKEPYFQSLLGDPRFGALVAHAKEVAAAAQSPD